MFLLNFQFSKYNPKKLRLDLLQASKPTAALSVSCRCVLNAFDTAFLGDTVGYSVSKTTVYQLACSEGFLSTDK